MRQSSHHLNARRSFRARITVPHRQPPGIFIAYRVTNLDARSALGTVGTPDPRSHNIHLRKVIHFHDHVRTPMIRVEKFWVNPLPQACGSLSNRPTSVPSQRPAAGTRPAAEHVGPVNEQRSCVIIGLPLAGRGGVTIRGPAAARWRRRKRYCSICRLLHSHPPNKLARSFRPSTSLGRLRGWKYCSPQGPKLPCESEPTLHKLPVLAWNATSSRRSTDNQQCSDLCQASCPAAVSVAGPTPSRSSCRCWLGRPFRSHRR